MARDLSFTRDVQPGYMSFEQRAHESQDSIRETTDIYHIDAPALRADLQAVVIMHAGTGVLYTECANISTTGILLKNVDLNESVGETVKLRITSKDLKKTITPVGRIVRYQDKENHRNCGIQFTGLLSWEKNLIAEFVSFELHRRQTRKNMKFDPIT